MTNTPNMNFNIELLLSRYEVGFLMAMPAAPQNGFIRMIFGGSDGFATKEVLFVADDQQLSLQSL